LTKHVSSSPRINKTEHVTVEAQGLEVQQVQVSAEGAHKRPSTQNLYKIVNSYIQQLVKVTNPCRIRFGKIVGVVLSFSVHTIDTFDSLALWGWGVLAKALFVLVDIFTAEFLSFSDFQIFFSMASCDSQSKNSCEIRRLDTLDGRVELFESFKQRLEQRLEELQVKSWKKVENGNLFKKHQESIVVVVL